jgi:hypothetical protein
MAHRGTAPLLARRVAAPVGEREVIPRVPLRLQAGAPGSCAALVHAFTARCPGLPADLREASPPALRGQPRVQRVFVCFRSAPDGPRAPPPASRAGAGHPGAAPGAGTFEPGSVPGPFGSTAGGFVPLAFALRKLAYPGWGSVPLFRPAGGMRPPGLGCLSRSFSAGPKTRLPGSRVPSRSLSPVARASQPGLWVCPAVPPCGRNAPIPVGRMC